MDQKSIYDYLQPIVSRFGGIMKREGYMTVHHDVLIMMTYDRSFLTIVPIKPLNIVYISYIKAFINAKKNPELFMQNTQFLGSFQIYNEMVEKYEFYNNALNTNESIYDECLIPYQIYEEDDMYNLAGFTEASNDTKLSWIKFNDGQRKYKLCVSKSLFLLNKGDYSSISIYDLFHDNTRVFKYRIHKPKIKLYADIITRQLIFESTD